VQLPLDTKHTQQERDDLGLQQDGLATSQGPVCPESVLGQEVGEGRAELHP